jgi:hypothetical protein
MPQIQRDSYIFSSAHSLTVLVSLKLKLEIRQWRLLAKLFNAIYLSYCFNLAPMLVARFLHADRKKQILNW